MDIVPQSNTKLLNSNSNIEFFNENFDFIKENFDFIKDNFENIKKILTIIQINNTSNKNNSKLTNRNQN